MKTASVVHVAWLLVALTSACGSKSDNGSKEDGPGSSKSSQAKAGTPPIGTFTCKAVKDSTCTGATDHFDASADVLHVLYTTKDLPKKGDVFLTKWIAEDVGDAAPANTVVATHESTVGEISSDFVSYTVEGELKQPTKGWPKGSYRVEILLGEKVVTSAKFKID